MGEFDIQLMEALGAGSLEPEHVLCTMAKLLEQSSCFSRLLVARARQRDGCGSYETVFPVGDRKSVRTITPQEILGFKRSPSHLHDTLKFDAPVSGLQQTTAWLIVAEPSESDSSNESRQLFTHALRFAGRLAERLMEQKTIVLLLRLFDAHFLEAVRQGELSITSIKELMWQMGHILDNRCRLGNVLIIRILPRPAAAQAKSRGKVVEFAYPEEGSKTQPSKERISELITDLAILTCKIPFFPPSGRDEVGAEWLILVDNPSRPEVRKRISSILAHAAESIGRVLEVVTQRIANRAAVRFLSFRSFQQKAADNYLAYALIRHAHALLGPLVKASAMFRLSRTSCALELIAQKPDGIPKDGPTKADVGDFLNAFAPMPDFGPPPGVYDRRSPSQKESLNRRNREHKEAVKQWIARRKKFFENHPALRCVVLALGEEDIDGIRLQTESLSSLLAEVTRPAQLAAEVAVHPVVVPITTMGTNICATLMCDRKVTGERLETLTHSVLQLASSVPLVAGEIIIFLPFGAKVGEGPDGKIALSDPELTPKKTPVQLHALPFCGAVVVAIQRDAFCSLRLTQLSQATEYAMQPLDGFSQQRLQLHIFTLALEKIADAPSLHALHLATEFAAVQLFDCAGIIEWDSNAVRASPSYVSPAFGGCEIGSRESDFPLQAGDIGSFNLPEGELMPGWLQTLADYIEAERPTAGGRVGEPGISGLTLRVATKRTSRLVFFIRPCASRLRALDIVFSKSLATALTTAMVRLGVDEPARSTDPVYPDWRGLIDKCRNTDDLLAAQCDQLGLWKEIQGYLLFQVDFDAQVLTLKLSSETRSKARAKGGLIHLSDESLATACANLKQPLLGVRKGKRLVVSHWRRSGGQEFLVPFLNWAPVTHTVLALYFTMSDDLDFVLVLAPEKSLSQPEIRGLYRRASHFLEHLSWVLRIERSLRRVELRDFTQQAHRDLVKEGPSRPLPPVKDILEFPPEVEAFYPPSFRKVLDNLLHKYLEMFGWHSAVLRISDWTETSLCRIAHAGVIGDESSLPIDRMDGVTGYAYRASPTLEKRSRVISLPKVSREALRTLRLSYEGLEYREARAGTRSEVCLALRNTLGQAFGTLNVESTRSNGLAFTKWGCMRLAEALEDALNSRTDSYRASLEAAGAYAGTLFGHAYHEMKTELNPLQASIRKEWRTQRPKADHSKVDELFRKERSRIVTRMNASMERRRRRVNLQDLVFEAMEVTKEVRTHTSGQIDVEQQHLGREIEIEINVPLALQAITALLGHVYSYCSRDKSANRIRIITSMVDRRPWVGSQRWVLCVGHSGKPIDRKLAQKLFWFPVESSSGSTGVGLAFLGVHFQMLDCYARVFPHLPHWITTWTKSKERPIKTWFVITGQVANPRSAHP